MRFLKKVTVSALGGTGTIVDSLVSGSDEATNAPSIRAVKEKLGGGNLLFNSDFLCQDTSADDIAGWTYTDFRVVWTKGLQAVPRTTPSLVSPDVAPLWNNVAGVFDYPITFSFYINLIASGAWETVSITINDDSDTSDKVIKDLGDGVNLILRPKTSGLGAYHYEITTTGDIPDATAGINIGRIKCERGATATPFTPSMYDCAVVNTMREINAAMVAGLKVFEFSGTLPSSTSSYVDLTIDSGYNAAVLAAYAYNSTDSEFCEMAKPDVVGAAYYRPTIFTHGNKARIYMDATSVTNYASQAYKVYLIGWKNT